MRSVVAVFFALGLVTNSHGAPIQFFHQGSASGIINGVPFSETPFSIFALGNTDNLTEQSDPHVFSIDHSFAEIQIAGLGIIEFDTPTRTFYNLDSDLVGFARAGLLGSDLIDGPFGGPLENWNMRSSIGPTSSSGHVLQWNDGVILTNGVALTLNTASQVFLTFTAIVTPEPSSLCLCIGSIVLLGIRRQS